MKYVKLKKFKCTELSFLPYFALSFVFRETYLNSYLIGEGLSGFVPAIAALIQGVGGNPECRNVTHVSPDGNITSIIELYTPGNNLMKFLHL
jgi:hypothetical protein